MLFDAQDVQLFSERDNSVATFKPYMTALVQFDVEERLTAAAIQNLYDNIGVAENGIPHIMPDYLFPYAEVRQDTNHLLGNGWLVTLSYTAPPQVWRIADVLAQIEANFGVVSRTTFNAHQRRVRR